MRLVFFLFIVSGLAVFPLFMSGEVGKDGLSFKNIEINLAFLFLILYICSLNV